MEFVLIRHTRCDVPAGTCYGWLDVPLAKSSHADIEQTLAQTPSVDAIFASPSRRCQELARALARRDARSVQVMPDLMELHFGEWEGQRWDDIPREQSDPWAEDPWNRAPPRGESERALWVRVLRAMTQFLPATELHTSVEPTQLVTAEAPHASTDTWPTSERLARPRIAIVSHGGPLRLLSCLLTGTPVEQRWARSIECGNVVRIECTPERLVMALRESASRSSGP